MHARSRSPVRTRTASVLLLLSTFGLLPAIVSAQELPTLTPDDYGQFERLLGPVLDPSGEWLATSVRRVDGTTELRLHATDREGEAMVLPHATRASFSSDSRWLAFSQGVSDEEREAADGPVRDRLGLVDLEAGTDTVLVPMSSFAFRDDGAWIAVRGHPVADSVGADLMVMRPGTSEMILLGNVDAFRWQDEGSQLAFTRKTAWGSANGVALLNPETGVVRTLENADADYSGLTWDDDSARLAVYRSREVESIEEDAVDLLVWDDALAGEAAQVLEGAGRTDLDEHVGVTDFTPIRFHQEGAVISIGVRPGTPVETDSDEEVEGDEADEDEAADEEDSEDDEVEPADVQVWHWDDQEILRAQEWSAPRDARSTHLALWHRDADRVVVLGENYDEPVRLVDEARFAIVADYDPYAFDRRFGSGMADWYTVDTETGERELLASGIHATPTLAPVGSRMLVWQDGAWQAVDLESGEWTAVTPTDAVDFEQSWQDYDYPGERPPYFGAAWSEDGRTAWVHGPMDVWEVDTDDGSAERVTTSAETGLQYRLRTFGADFDDDPGFGPGDAIWMTTRHPDTKASGLARIVDGEVEDLVLQDAQVSFVGRAEDAEVYMLTMQRWEDSPDVFVTDDDFDDFTQVTETNPFQSDYAWGRNELLSYTTDAGYDLHAILTYPADFEEGQQYPLILYQYEKLSNSLHSYQIPSETNYYDYQSWSQAGYFVLRPDIVYEPGRPGPSALDAVNHALDAAVATGHVDPDAMGLIGHSWGGYQAAYLPTRTNRFAASVAGAAITDFISFMGAVHWNGGLPEVGHWETGQARMARPAWEDLEGHLESSPVNFIHELETPVLVMHGDQDGVVDFRQGLEYYNYARRAGKPVVMLVYPGADHGLSDESQQVDYHRRILEWFDHYLRGAPAASWITEGESWQERSERLGG